MAKPACATGSDLAQASVPDMPIAASRRVRWRTPLGSISCRWSGRISTLFCASATIFCPDRLPCSALFGRIGSGNAPRSLAATICRSAAKSGSWPEPVRRPKYAALHLKKPRRDRQKDAHGEVAEWLKAHAWKACIRETVSRVQIPLSPPIPIADIFSKSFGALNLR